MQTSPRPLELDPVPLPRLDPSAEPDQALELLEQHGMGVLRLQFCDIFGTARSVEVPARRLPEAMRGEVVTDASAVEGAPGTEEAVLRLVPDAGTLAVLPWREGGQRVAQLVCDLRRADGSPFEGDPRAVLRRAEAELREEGFQARVAAEVEFFLLERPESGEAGKDEDGGAFRLLPAGRGELARRDAVLALEAMGRRVDTAHREAAPGQHEITLAPAEPLHAADSILTLKQVVRSVAAGHGLRAVFMPKPWASRTGAGLHTHLSLFRDGRNAFHDPDGAEELSETLRHFVGGLLHHARACCAVTNPLVNSYKRLVAGHEAPTSVAWSLHNRSLPVRVPPPRGESTSCEHRLADPAANPYLALAVQLAAGLDGIRAERHPGDPISRNVALLTPRERQRLRIDRLPRSLAEALDELERSRAMRAVLGEYLYSHLVERKRAEWAEYSAEVHGWELRRYLEL